MVKNIISGGQTGVDQAILDVAIKLGSPMAVGFQMGEEQKPEHGLKNRNLRKCPRPVIRKVPNKTSKLLIAFFF
jgi:hypothetical protein